MGKLDGKVAAITGGTRSIGRAMADAFLAEGAKVVVNGRNEEKGAECLAEMNAGDNAVFFGGDASTQATAEGKVLLQLLVEARGELEIEPVTQQIESTPALQEGLLRLVNSLELARAQKIENVGQALIMIGARRTEYFE